MPPPHMSHKISKPTPENKPTPQDGKLLEKLDDDILKVNQLRGTLKQCPGSPHHTIDDELRLEQKQQQQEKGEEEEKVESIADENWQIASEYYKNIDTKAFRQYELACDRVRQFYEEQHERQTVAYNIQARINFKTKTRAKMSVWEGLERLNKLLDDSDPDTELSQIDHALQTAEAIRRDGKPRWFQLVGLIHDLGKLLYFFDSKGQWDVVGDTFPVGCKFLKRIIFPDSFKANPDFLNPLYNTKYGIYSKHCGLDKVMLSWGHDEYMYHVAKKNSTLPPEALAMIRYHSFYPWHQELAYSYLMDDHDKEMLRAVKAFNAYDLYSKTDQQYEVEELKPYYLELIDEFFPNKIIDF
ncbi:Inositol oxygenase 1 [Candida viswanathii]|uniref:Inositol oxygenase n=1 Tax=Candida viswanathii TaxID=5486 RepID=A0A367YH93_9ASCO|nr:Inositol oxygenase 1 [Candida viswanathii]